MGGPNLGLPSEPSSLGAFDFANHFQSQQRWAGGRSQTLSPSPARRPGFLPPPENDGPAAIVLCVGGIHECGHEPTANEACALMGLVSVDGAHVIRVCAISFVEGGVGVWTTKARNSAKDAKHEGHEEPQRARGAEGAEPDTLPHRRQRASGLRASRPSRFFAVSCSKPSRRPSRTVERLVKAA